MVKDIDFYKEYFETVATNNIAIGHTAEAPHYCIMILDDLLTKQRNLNYPALCVQDAYVRLKDFGSAQHSAKVKGAFVVMENVGRGGVEEQTDAVAACTEIANDIIKKMKNDRKKLVFVDLSIEAFEITIIGPVNGDCYGVLVDYEFEHTINMGFDESKWNNETKA
jgi:hypothetical protein